MLLVVTEVLTSPEGICDDLVEVKVDIVNKRYGIVYFHRANASTPYRKCTSTNWYKTPNGERFRPQALDRDATIHQVFRVRLNATKEYFVLDLSNAQFG